MSKANLSESAQKIAPLSPGPAGVSVAPDLRDSAAHNLLTTSSASYYNTILQKPWKWFYILLLAHIASIVISLILWGAGYDIYHTQFRRTAINPVDDGMFQQSAVWSAAQQDASNNLWAQKIPTRATRSVSAMPTQIIYSSSSNCLTKANLYAIKTLEQTLFNSSAYKAICQLQPDGTCRPPRSIMRFFDGSYAGYGIYDSFHQNIFRADPTFDRITEIVTTAFDANGNSDATNIKNASQPDLQVLLNYVVGKDYNNFAVSSAYCRTMVYSGLPLTGYRTDKDSTGEQLSLLGKLQMDAMDSYLTDRGSLGDMKMVYQSEGMQERRETSQRGTDYLIAIGSLVFMGLALLIQTHSAWIAVFTMINALCAYAWANLIYRIILQFRSYGDPQALAGYLVAQLCAVFAVYMTHVFRQACNVPELQTAEARLGTMLRTTHRTILTVCLVMMLAFFVSAASSYVVVVNYCVFCGVLCITSYISTMVFTPAIIVTWYTYWSARYNCLAKSTARVSLSVNTRASTSSAPALPSPLARTPLQAFFKGHYVNSFVAHPVLRWLLISASVIIVGAFLIAAAVLLGVSRSQPVLWRSNTNDGKFTDLQQSVFGQSDQDTAVRLHIVWGLRGRDASVCHASDLTCLPAPLYSDTFDLLPHTTQNKLLDFCTGLKSVSATTESALGMRRKATGDNGLEVRCFIDAQHAFLNTTAYPLPFNLNDLAQLVHDYPSLYPSSTPSSAYANVGTVSYPEGGTYYRAYEMSALHWLSNASSSGYPSADYTTYSGLIGGQADSSLRRTSNTLNFAGYFGDRIRYAAIVVNLTISTVNQDQSAGLAVLDAWAAYVQAAAAALPPALQSVFVATPGSQTWAWLQVSRDTVRSLMRGVALSLMFLFLGITLATGNWILGVISLVTSLFVVFLIFGIAAFDGWDLGVIESVLFTFVVPLTVLPIALVTLAFNRTSSSSRKQRLRIALSEAGPPTLFAGLFGLGTSVFLFGARLQFIFEYGALYFATAGLGSLYALVFLAGLLGVAGPQRPHGRLWRAQTPANRSGTLPLDSGILRASEIA
eukprot:m.201044 g.201044  ORF g.201044 m.201044 type:complete len:1056 (+) comp10103_c0_seq9:60-3227(+)